MHHQTATLVKQTYVSSGDIRSSVPQLTRSCTVHCCEGGYHWFHSRSSYRGCQVQHQGELYCAICWHCHDHDHLVHSFTGLYLTDRLIPELFRPPEMVQAFKVRQMLYHHGLFLTNTRCSPTSLPPLLDTSAARQMRRHQESSSRLWADGPHKRGGKRQADTGSR